MDERTALEKLNGYISRGKYKIPRTDERTDDVRKDRPPGMIRQILPATRYLARANVKSIGNKLGKGVRK